MRNVNRDGIVFVLTCSGKNNIKGIIEFDKVKSGVHVHGEITGLPTGYHGSIFMKRQIIEMVVKV